MAAIERQFDSGHWHAVRGKPADLTSTGVGREEAFSKSVI
jgi:hypothetical protein